ncbi:hypothetical protein [Alkalibacillus almallahensis]|uniref:hypothetical protein n=1 Tax=Alkalibacillus almallahensis TaxID=1379154 RepID=UPI00141DEDFC|nr:hypothetical protein [Alkalibacillus almallahensis]NIK13138.1 hypothetical protein [Alkalibacillus almallahensis]
MSYYEKAEQETIYNYDVTEGEWRVYSTYPPHVRKILNRCNVQHAEQDGNGLVISVTATAKQSQIRLYN